MSEPTFICDEGRPHDPHHVRTDSGWTSCAGRTTSAPRITRNITLDELPAHRDHMNGVVNAAHQLAIIGEQIVLGYGSDVNHWHNVLPFSVVSLVEDFRRERGWQVYQR